MGIQSTHEYDEYVCVCQILGSLVLSCAKDCADLYERSCESQQSIQSKVRCSLYSGKKAQRKRDKHNRSLHSALAFVIVSHSQLAALLQHGCAYDVVCWHGRSWGYETLYSPVMCAIPQAWPAAGCVNMEEQSILH